MNAYDRMKTKLAELVEENHWGGETVRVAVRTLTADEAIGNPADQDYPIIKGRERMIEADFLGARGQAFTDTPAGFSGAMDQITSMDLKTGRERAVFLATLNAVMRRASLAERSIHCRDDDPPACARELVDYVRAKYGRPRIALVGLQPRMVQNLAAHFEIRVTDLDEDNIGREKFGVRIDGPERTRENLEWCELALMTGSTLANGTFLELTSDKPTVYFGVTVAGPAAMLNLERFCPLGH